jgi:YesN/AraC family two-component response regulator
VSTFLGEDHVISYELKPLDMNHLLSVLNQVTKRREAEEKTKKLIQQLQDALAKVKLLSGLITICTSCKKIWNDKGFWEQIELYISTHSEADFTHGVCPDCAKKIYPDIYELNPDIFEDNETK